MVLWDLREPLSMHSHGQGLPGGWGQQEVGGVLPRVPTFSTGEGVVSGGLAVHNHAQLV